ILRCTKKPSKNSMILIRIHGGLGNQMFEYALGLSLSQKHAVPFKLDYSYLKEVNQSGRDFRLFGFNITAPEATPQEIRSYIGTRQKVMDRLRKPGNRKRIVERAPDFNPQILTRADGYFDGHWPSAEYFKGAEELVRKEFSLKKPFGPGAAHAETEI